MSDLINHWGATISSVIEDFAAKMFRDYIRYEGDARKLFENEIKGK